jgi:uncharacterized protein YhaN
MRIDRLDLLAFGRFTNTSLDLSGGDEGLHLIYGDNEAGKSTSLRALIAWLFGIPARTRDNFLHSNAQLRIGGRLRLANGRILEFVRRKGNKGTVLDPASGEVMDEKCLVPFLPQGIDETLFKNLYGIDHDRLVAGGRELLDQSGDVGQALFSAAAGTAGLKKVVADLRSEAQDLFKPRASTKVINQALMRYKETRRQLKEATFPVAEWKRLRSELDETLGQIREIEEVIRRTSEEKNRLERLLRVKGALAERRTVMQRLDELENVPLLPENFEEECALARKDLSTGDKERKKALSKLDFLEQEARTLHVRQDLLDHEAEIVRLFKAMGAVEKIHEDRPQLEAQKRLLRNKAHEYLKGVRPDVSFEDVEQLRPLLENKPWVTSLASQHQVLAQKRETAKTRVQEIVEERDVLWAELKDIPTVHLDVREIKAVVAAAGKAGDLEARLEETRQRARQEQKSLETAFGSLGRFAGSMDQLASVAMPVAETLDRYEKKFDTLHETRKDVENRLRDVREECRSVEQELGALLLKDHVPTVEELKTARSARDQGWKLVRGVYIEQRRDLTPRAEAFAPTGDLVQTYEKHVLQADSIADALRAGSDQVAKRANLEMRKRELEERIRDLTRKRDFLEEDATRVKAAWQGIWKPLGIEAGTPREMKQWLLRVEKFLADMESARRTTREITRLNEELVRHKNAVGRQMRLLDPGCSLQDMELVAMIAWCEERIQGVEKSMARRKEVQKSLEKAEPRMTRAQEALKGVETEQVRWQKEWKQAIAGLGVTPDRHPKVVLNVLDRLESLFRTVDEYQALDRRLYGMDKVEQEFEASVRTLAERARWDMSGQQATTFVARLNKDVAQAREARTALKKINAQQQDLRQELKEAEISIRAAQKKLAELRERANVSRDEDLDKVGEISRKKRDLAARREQLEQELARNGDGLSIEALEAEYEQARVDVLDAELDKKSLTLEEFQKKRDQLRDERQALQTKMHANDGSSLAAGALQDAQEQLAVMVSGAEEYLRLRIAELMLEQQIEAYRKENQGPLLSRAGELFARLTLGSYAGLRDELDNAGVPVLLGIRPNDDEVPVDGMSEGTRDQLYLALRLATLEKHLGTGEPMPFVVDDILVGFDDNRTRVGLEVLADLASQTQVLLFTHHTRVVDLARGVEGGAGMFVHRL